MSDHNFGAGRGTGRTSRQMQSSMHGAFFVVPSGMQNYARSLANSLRREDLQIVPQCHLHRGHFDGRRVPDLVMDHAVKLSPDQHTVVEYVQPLIGRH